MRRDDLEVFTGFLTTREKQVAALVGRGATYQAIADRLGISAHTARSHAKTVAAKLPKLYGIPAQRRVAMWAETSDGRANLHGVIGAPEAEEHEREAIPPSSQAASQAA